MADANALHTLETVQLGDLRLSRLWNDSRAYSMLVPDEWAVGRTDKFETLYIGPETAGLQINLGVARTELARGNRLTVQLLGKQVLEFLKTTYNNFELLGERELPLDETRPALLRVFSWVDPTTTNAVVQMMVLAADGNTLYDVTGTLAKTAAPTYMPLLESMVLSMRFGQPATATTILAVNGATN